MIHRAYTFYNSRRTYIPRPNRVVIIIIFPSNGRRSFAARTFLETTVTHLYYKIGTTAASLPTVVRNRFRHFDADNEQITRRAVFTKSSKRITLRLFRPKRE